MPLYDYRCPVCGEQEEIFAKISELDNIHIPCCGTEMERVLSAPAVMADIQPYQSMITGEMIMGRAQHKKHLREHKMIEVGNEKVESKPYDPGKCDHNVRPDLTQVTHQVLSDPRHHKI